MPSRGYRGNHAPQFPWIKVAERLPSKKRDPAKQKSEPPECADVCRGIHRVFQFNRFNPSAQGNANGKKIGRAAAVETFV